MNLMFSEDQSLGLKEMLLLYLSKTQSFYQSILQNSTLVVKVSGKICDNQNIENVIGDIEEPYQRYRTKSCFSFWFWQTIR